ncbi:MAG: hypothetical protein AAGI01_08980 [Myxococcota bacterium]
MRHFLTGAPLDEVRRLAMEHGLDVVEAWRHGVMLVLRPRDLGALPDRDALRELADALGGDGVRYVTLSLWDLADECDE